MTFEKVHPETINLLYKRTKLQMILDEFASMEDSAIRLVFAPGEYASVYTAQRSYRSAINRLHYPMTAKVLQGSLYLIKLHTKEVQHETLA